MAMFTSFLLVLVLLVGTCTSNRPARGALGKARLDYGSTSGRKCSGMPFVLDLKSECCGKHAGLDKHNQDATYHQEYRYRRSAHEADIAPEKYIYGGQPTGLAQYPWLVYITVAMYTKRKNICGKQEGGTMLCQLQYVGTVYKNCGGSLISSRHIISAAHCFKEPNRTDNVQVTLAEYNTSSHRNDCVRREGKCIMNLIMLVDKIHIHSEYAPKDVLYNDIAMLRLKRSAPYTDYIRPICLPSFNINAAWYEGTLLTVAGWGLKDGNRRSSVKRHAPVRMVAPVTCKKDYPVLTDGMLCAAGTRGQDACNGDSGGPLMWEHKGSFFLVGVVSAKNGACGTPAPTKYTNVFSYMKWILDFMKE